jgi:erythromycin esterase-like protein
MSAGVVVFLAISAVLAQPNEFPIDWVRTRAIRLTSAEAGRGFADMQPLKRVIGDARIVSLGEATHGTREFFQLKHRMLEFLVKWILDHNPKARIVLWAHNGHVAAGGFASGGFPSGSMGSALRRMYGSEMVVFGFAFNQGSFQAVAQGGGGLKTFTVPPASAGTLDGALASVGIPLFALDLRGAPAWFEQPRGARQIGAMYPEDQPYASVANIVPREAFDVLLFVDTTTAARKNPGR